MGVDVLVGILVILAVGVGGTEVGLGFSAGVGGTEVGLGFSMGVGGREVDVGEVFCATTDGDLVEATPTVVLFWPDCADATIMNTQKRRMSASTDEVSNSNGHDH